MRFPGLVFLMFLVMVIVGACSAPGSSGSAGPSAGATSPSASSSASSSPSPGPSSSPSSSPRPPKLPRGTDVGYVVYDRSAGRTLLTQRAGWLVRSASIVKIWMVLDYLAAGNVPAGDKALMRAMLRVSDDQAATVIWRKRGQGEIIKRQVERLGLRDTVPPPAGQPGYWGFTAISARDVARTYRYILDEAEPPVRRFVMENLRKAATCGKDGYDQSFGLPAAVRGPVAVKQGWSGFGTAPAERCTAGGGSGPRPPMAAFAPARDSLVMDSMVRADPLGLGRPVLHTTGTVGRDDELIVVVLSLHPAGGSFADSANRLTRITKDIYRAAT